MQLCKANNFSIFNDTDGASVNLAIVADLSTYLVEYVGSQCYFICNRSCCAFCAFLHDFIGYALQIFGVLRGIASGLISSSNFDRCIFGNGRILNNSYGCVCGGCRCFTKVDIKCCA